MIVNKGAFAKGAVLMVSFLGIFFLIMSPVFHGKNGLEFSDDFFDKLAKNSSDYFDTVKAASAKMKGKQLAVTATISKPDPKDVPDPAKAQERANADAQTAAKALTAAGAQVEVKDNVLNVKCDLGALMEFSAAKAEAVFHVHEEVANAPENVANRKLTKDIWKAMGAMIKPLQRDGKVTEAKALDTVMRKALEPAYNFYGIDGEPVSKNAVMLAFLLVFYVVYTLWYGYSIFFMFEGIGMSMKKSKKKG